MNLVLCLTINYNLYFHLPIICILHMPFSTLEPSNLSRISSKPLDLCLFLHIPQL